MFVVAGYDPTEVLQPAECVFDEMTALVSEPAIVDDTFAVGPTGNDGDEIAHGQSATFTVSAGGTTLYTIGPSE